MALGYTIEAILKGSSHVFHDERRCVCSDSISLRVQGKDCRPIGIGGVIRSSYIYRIHTAKEGIRGSRGNLVDVARHWVEKQGLLPSSEELPLTERPYSEVGSSTSKELQQK